MKINFKFLTVFSLVFIEAAVFLIVFLITRDNVLVSNIFFGISVLVLVLLFCQYFFIQRINNKKKKLENSNSTNKEKELQRKELSKDKKRNWESISLLIVPFLMSLIIAIVMAFV